MPRTRRGLLTGLVAVLAGCTAPGDDGSPAPTAPATDPAGGDATEPPTTAPGTPTPIDGTTWAGELDLREANVTGVESSHSGGAVTFDVTLYHDDDGEEGYANWWQVERLDGTQVGRRVLTHPHSTKPFTRSDTYEVPDDVTCVVVRGHDQTHGYGGQAAVVNLESGAVSLVDQGSERRSFSESDCP
jgi:hypothetical protein